MIEITIPNNLRQIITTDIINDIILKLFNLQSQEFNIEYVTQVVKFLILKRNNKKHYVLFSGSTDGRNSFLIQRISTAFYYFNFDEFQNKQFYVYLLDTGSKAKTNYQKFVYRGLETLDIKILNLNELNLEVDKFRDYFDFRNNRRNMNRNNNNSSFFDESDENFNFYGKVFGANGKESTFLTLVLSKLTNKPIKFYQVVDYNIRTLFPKDKQLLRKFDVFVQEEVIKDYNNSLSFNVNRLEDLRDTPKFHYNLFKKYGDKKCLLCDCDIDRMIIGAHIHRVTDISRDTNISTENKITQIIDSNNGFWLCSNHDKLFEWGLIYFNNENLEINSQNLEETQIEFIRQITNIYTIPDNYYGNELQFYLSKHKTRFET